MEKDWSKYKRQDEWSKYKRSSDLEKSEDHKGWQDYLSDSLKFIGDPSSVISRNFSKPITASLLNFSQNIGNGLSDIGQPIIKNGKIEFQPSEKIDYWKEMGISEDEQKKLSNQLIKYAPHVASAIATPEFEIPALASYLAKALPRLGKYLTKGVQTGVPQGIVTGLTSDEDKLKYGAEAGGITGTTAPLSQLVLSGNPYLRTGSRMLLGGGLSYLGGQTGSSIGDITGIPGASTLGAGLLGTLGFLAGSRGRPTSYAQRTISKDLEKYPNYKENIAASERLGTQITPAEATADVNKAVLQGKVERSQSGSQIMSDFGKTRLESEQNAINTLKDIIFPISEKPQIQKLYNEAFYDAPVILDKRGKITADFKKNHSIRAPEVLSEFENNEIFKKAEKLMLKEPEYMEALKGAPRDSVEYLNGIKRIIGDREFADNIGNFKKSSLTKTRIDLTKSLDDISGGYKKARNLDERYQTLKDIEKFYDKRKQTGQNMKKMLESKEDYNQLLNHVRDIPEAQQYLKDMKQIFPNFLSPNSIQAARALEKGSINKARSAMQYLEEALAQKLGLGVYDKELAKLMTHPKWYEQIGKLKEVSPLEKYAGLGINVGGKGLASQVEQF